MSLEELINLKKLLNDELNYSRAGVYADQLLTIKLALLECALNPSSENESAALRELNIYKEYVQGNIQSNSQELTWKAEPYKELVNFTNKIGVFYIVNKHKDVSDYILHTMNHYRTKIMDTSPIIVLLAIITSPVIFMSSVVSGIIDWATRKPLQFDDTADFLSKLNTIPQATNMEEDITTHKQSIIQEIIDKYDAHSSFGKSSESSNNLIKHLTNPYGDITHKWGFLVSYASDTERNEGKALHTIIKDVIMNDNYDYSTKAEKQKKENSTKLQLIDNIEGVNPDIQGVFKEIFMRVREQQENKSADPKDELKPRN